MPTTLKDLAAHLGISAAAVSLALNDKPGVSPDTRASVIAAASELGYRANRSGKALRLNRTGNVGVYFPSTIMQYSLYFAEITRGIAAGLAGSDLSPLLLPSAHDQREVRAFPDVDGFIIVEPHDNDPGMFELLRSGLPTVCIDPPPPNAAPAWGIVEPDTSIVTADSLTHLRSRGSDHPALLVIEQVSEWSRLLREHYRSWCAANGVSPAIITTSIDMTNEEIQERLAEHLDASTPARDGLFVSGDGFAPRVAGILRTMGHAPEDGFPLVSGVDSTMMEFHTPPITAINLDPFRYGGQAARMMTKLLTAPKRPSTPLVERLPAPLVVRAT